MEYGQLVELVIEKYGYDRLGANAFIGSLFFSIAKDEQIARIVTLVQEKN